MVYYRKIPCSFCKKKFLRRTGQINEARKFGWRQYCSRKCLSADKVTSVEKACTTCGRKIYRTLSDLSKSKLGKFFCSHTCSAIFTNHLRGKPVTICRAKNCDKQAPRGNIYCSRTCAGLTRRRDKNDIAKEVTYRIKNFSHWNGRIPVKKEMYDIYKKARKSFGSWNKAIAAAGYKPNPVMFAEKHTARDGHKCDSLAEKIIDDWFYSKDISHKRSIPYPQFKLNRMTCDFIVGGYFIEFFGLDGEHRRYTELAKKKRLLSKKYKIKLIEIKPNDLFPKNKLDEALSFLI